MGQALPTVYCQRAASVWESSNFKLKLQLAICLHQCQKARHPPFCPAAPHKGSRHTVSTFVSGDHDRLLLWANAFNKARQRQRLCLLGEYLLSIFLLPKFIQNLAGMMQAAEAQVGSGYWVHKVRHGQCKWEGGRSLPSDHGSYFILTAFGGKINNLYPPVAYI